MLKLDFTIASSTDRNEFVTKFFEQNPDYKPTAKELETVTNYILYGKDEDGTSVVDRKQIYIDTKYNSYNKRKAESLDGLTETPGFNELTIKPTTKLNIFKTIKPSIDREDPNISEIPGMKDLWKSIDGISRLLDVNSGKVEPSANELDEQGNLLHPLTPQQMYQMKHHLIDMRKQQYALKESSRPTEHLYNANVHKAPNYADSAEPVNWDQYYFFPLGLYIGDTRRFDNPANYDRKISRWDKMLEPPHGSIDFTNGEHIALLVKQYQDLTIQAEDDCESCAGGIVATLEFYIARTTLPENYSVVLQCRMDQWSNGQIKQKLDGMGYHHSENYISTIFKEICNNIAATAKLHYDYFLLRDNDEMWKTCSCCGRRKLRDAREFMRKAKSSDGYSNVCKVCDKEKREKRKRG